MNPTPNKPNRWRPITVFNLLVGLLFSLSALGQPAFLREGLVAYYPFNGNANDGSGNGNDGVASGTTPFSDRFNKEVGALRFNGDGANVKLGPQVTSVISNGIFSFSFWVKISSGGTWSPRLMTSGMVDVGIDSTTGSAKVFYGGSGFDSGNNIWSTDRIESSKYYNIAGTYDRFKAALYINGKLVATQTSSWGARGYKNATATVGINPENGSDRFSGAVDDVRIYNRALSDGEVKALYDYESTPPDNSFITNGLVAHYPFDGNAKDASGNENNGVVTGATLTTDRFGVPDHCYLFNGVTDNILATVASIPTNAQDRTLVLWEKLSGSTTSTAFYVPAAWGLNNNNQAFGLLAWSVPKIWAVQFWGGGQDLNSTQSADNDWHQIACVLESNIAKFYYDGVLKASSLKITSTGFSQLFIGKGVEKTGTYFPGSIDDVRIYNRALSDGEVKALYDYESTPQPLNPRIATATAQLVNGFVVGATITDGGYGYVENPVVAITGGGGTGARATATQFNGVVTSITITNPGSGYTSTPTITIAPPPFPPRKATSTAQVVNGFVVGTKITDGGFGYDSPPAVLLVGGGGSGATAVATVANGVVTAITITNPGTGYTSVPIVRIASPPFAPKLAIETSKVYVRMSVVLGRKYQLEASTDLNTWTTTGPAFIAQDEELVQEFDVNQVGRYFRINQVP